LPFQLDVPALVAVDVMIPSIVYQDTDLDACCGICNEPFTKFWDEDEEEWMLRNALKTNNVHPTSLENYSEVIYHFTCRNDEMQSGNASETDVIIVDSNKTMKRKFSKLDEDSSSNDQVQLAAVYTQ